MIRRVSSGVLFGTFLGSVAACDAGADQTTQVFAHAAPASAAVALVTGDAADVTAPRGPSRAFDPSLAHAPRRADKAAAIAEALRPTPEPKPPLDGSTFDNFTCDAAVALPNSGVVGAVIGQGDGTACFASDMPQSYFKLVVRPGEVVAVTSPQVTSSCGALWLGSAPSCGATVDECSAGATWTTEGVAIGNTGAVPVERIIAVTSSGGLPADATFDLAVSRTPFASNVTCERAMPIGDGLRNQDFRGASIEDSANWMRRALYYTAAIPPMTRARFDLGKRGAAAGLYVYLRHACGDELLSLDRPEIANTGDTPMTVQIVVGAVWQATDARFDVAMELAPLAPEAACDAPAELAIGEGTTLAIEDGARGPASCWCLSPERALHVAVTVPAGTTARVSAITDAQSGAQLVDLPTACTDTCGQEFASGWGEQAAVLDLANDSGQDVVRHLLVTSNPIWHEDGTVSFPPVAVTVGTPE